jgi:6-phosphogluconolactonase (cycloisomerase 2 family)
MNSNSRHLAVALLLGAILTLLGDFLALAQESGATLANLQARGVFTMTNDASGNAVLAFTRDRLGQLTPAGTFVTGGDGTGGGLGNQGALALSKSGRTLLVVNAGSDSISAFQVKPHELLRTSVVPSGGNKPISITLDGDRAYVLNAGSDSIAGFRMGDMGILSPITGSTKSLSTTHTGSAQISINPEGTVLVVTEKATQRLTTYALDDEGVPGDPQVQPSHGKTPFGFAFADRGHLLVSEAFGGAPGASALSSYDVQDRGSLKLVSGSIPSGETAACWVVVNDHQAYVSNTGSGTISSYSIDDDGILTLSDPQIARAAGPIDMAFSKGGQFLYVLSSGSKSIDAFQVQGAKLTAVGRFEVAPTADGLVAR